MTPHPNPLTEQDVTPLLNNPDNAVILSAIERLHTDVKNLDDAVRGTNTTKGIRTEINELQQFKMLVKYLMVSVWTALLGLITKAIGLWGG